MESYGCLKFVRQWRNLKKMLILGYYFQPLMILELKGILKTRNIKIQCWNIHSFTHKSQTCIASTLLSIFLPAKGNFYLDVLDFDSLEILTWQKIIDTDIGRKWGLTIRLKMITKILLKKFQYSETKFLFRVARKKRFE